MSALPAQDLDGCQPHVADPVDLAAVELRRVRVILAEQPVLRGIDLAVHRGAKLALVGPNGAGKSTLLRVVAGLLRPTGGEVVVGGRAMANDSWYARRAVGMVAHQSMLHPELTARENLLTYGRLYGLDRLGERVAAGLERVGLAARADARVATLSRGMVQRLALARALLHEPSVLLLDEAETGLDVRAHDLLVEALGGTLTAILATHDLAYVAEVADEVVFLARGRIVGRCPTSGHSPAELRDRYAEALAQRPAGVAD
jgi:ABC-type multidrug transport system ATPase subunit